jgi:glycosyltransferase involved in cell wall biosynthesis
LHLVSTQDPTLDGLSNQMPFQSTAAMLTTYPPTPCGIATFAAALTSGLESHGSHVEIVRIADELPSRDRRVVAHLDADSAASRRAAASVLNDADVAIIQHEFGIYGGEDGVQVLDVLDLLDTAPIVVAHTVLRDPTRHQRQIFEGVVLRAGTLIVMSQWARRVVVDGFHVDPDKVVVIPHGARTRASRASTNSQLIHARTEPLLVTWGLLGPGKGIEWVLDALGDLRRHGVMPQYLIAGQTHPKVLAREGEKYREMLERRVVGLELEGQVSFDPSYRTMDELDELIERASLVILPYDSIDQVTSGVLVDAVAGGCPVVATSFPHAVELLQGGAGVVVPRRDPRALAKALEPLLTVPGTLECMAATARQIAPTLAWDVVAATYLRVAQRQPAFVAS